MRIDKFLKNSRLIKRRTVAKDACDQERVSVNGKMVDRPVAIRAQRTIDLAIASGIIDPAEV